MTIQQMPCRVLKSKWTYLIEETYMMTCTVKVLKNDEHSEREIWLEAPRPQTPRKAKYLD